MSFLYKNSAIHFAARFGNVALLKIIVENGGDVHQLNEARHAPVDIAIKHGRNDAADYLREMEEKYAAKQSRALVE